MSLRTSAVVIAVAASFSACGGRAQTPSSDESSARGGAGGSGPSLPDDADGGTAGAATADVGSGGAMVIAEAGAPSGGGDEAEGGSGDFGGVGGSASCANSQGPFATDVLSYSFGGGQTFNQTSAFPGAILGPPVANDPASVVSLGNGGWVVLGFAGNAIVDGPGVDFTVFENPLPTFKELATVAVSDDAEHWVEFPCTAAQDAIDFGFCAGVGLVFSSPRNGIDPLDPTVSGGDHYDLADIGVSHARYLRITDRVDLDGAAGVFDLDAVAIVHGECL
ncbi:MAG: hypothetical protein ABIQ16_08045 [Polyangiaceae bacterium]